ncbi:MAG: TRAP transporter small permease, partial [Sulfitobacter sp.]
MLLTLRKVADGLISLSATFGALGLVVEIVVILIDVIGRALGSPLYGSQDMITMTMVILVFGGMALCDRKGGHISVDLFEKQFPNLMNKLVDIGSAVLGAVIFVFVAKAVWESAVLSEMLNLSTNLLRLPK